MKVYLVGVGLGNSATMTLAAREAIAASPLLIGAPRLLEGYDDKTCLPLIAAKDIAEPDRHKFGFGSAVDCLYDHFAKALGRSHDIGRIDGFVG